MSLTVGTTVSRRRACRYERLSASLVGPLDRGLLSELDNSILDSLAGQRRGIERDLQNRRRQRVDGLREQRIPFEEVRIRAQKTDIREPVAQESVVGLEALGQLLQCTGRADEAVNRRTIEPSFRAFERSCATAESICAMEALSGS